MRKLVNIVKVKRGDIFYIANGKYYITDPGNTSGRPAIIVSSDELNEHAPVVEIVYLTTQVKRPVKIACKIPSTALCETIHTVSKDRLGDYVRSCTDEEMKNINIGIRCSLGISDSGTNMDNSIS